MPSSIPVQVGNQQFNSMNQARLYYREILYRYQPGHTVNSADSSQVVSLLTSAAIGPRVPEPEDTVRVVKGSFGRKCFEMRSKEEERHLISILRAVKGCASGRDAKREQSTARDEHIDFVEKSWD